MVITDPVCTLWLCAERFSWHVCLSC